MIKVTVIILTKNEEVHLGRALENIRAGGFASKVVVVDSFSTDSTLALAEKFGAAVVQHKFINQAKQFNWALDNLDLDCDWIMRLDADEVIAIDLAQRIKETLPTLPQHVAGINLHRRHIFMGKWIRYGGRYPVTLTRIWRAGQGRIEDRWMDEHVVVEGGSVVTLSGGFADHNLNDLSFFVEKHNAYATREAIEIINSRLQLFCRSAQLTGHASSWQAAFKRRIKEQIYNRIPFELAAFLYFLWRYFLQFGFLDGRPGLIYHFLQGFWYRFLVGAKVVEFERAIAHLSEPQEMLAELSKLTGHDLLAEIN